VAWLLLPQFAVLVLGAAAAANRRWPRRAVAAASATLVVAVAGSLGADVRLLSHRAESVRLTSEQRTSRGGAAIGVRVAFVEWARRVIPPRKSVAVLFRLPGRNEAAYQWTAYRLFPRSVTDDATRADWIVFYGVEPASRGYFTAAPGLRVFAPGFAVARRHA
jgi:hypothetical protein